MKKSSPRRARSVREISSPVADEPADRKTVGSTLTNLFSIDARSLAAFRIAMGILLLTDLVIRATDLGSMYTDQGMFSRQVIHERYTSVWNWSFHFMSGSWEFQAVLFSLAAVLAVLMIAGFKTRLAVAGSWLLLISLQN